MKRFTGILTAAAIALAPMCASALETLTDSYMKNVTAQAGVSIAVDDIVICQEGIADTIYWDTDGLTAYVYNMGPDGTPGTMDDTFDSTSVGVTDAGVMIDYHVNTKKLITIDAIENATVAQAKGYTVAELAATFANLPEVIGYANSTADVAGLVDPTTGDFVDMGANDGSGSGANLDSFVTGASPLTIDVGTCEILTAGLRFNSGSSAANIAGVVIGLPTIEICQYNNPDARDIRIVSTDATAINNGKSFIQIVKSGCSKMAVLGGSIEIAAH